MNKALIIVPLSVAIVTKYKQERQEWLKKADLAGVFTLPGNLFQGQETGVHTCLMVWKKKTNPSPLTYLTNWKDDGFVILKGKRFDKHNKWPEIKNEWLKMFQQQDISQPTVAVQKELNVRDCWLANAWVETDYSQLTEEHFEKTIRDYLAFRISVIEKDKE